MNKLTIGFSNLDSIKHFSMLKPKNNYHDRDRPSPIVQGFIIKTRLQSMPQDINDSHDIDHTRNFTDDVTHKVYKFKFNLL